MKKQTFLHGSLILGGSALLAKVLGALFKIPLTSLLGGTGMGYFSCAYGLFLPLYAVLVTGLSTAVAKPVAACAARGDMAGAVRIRSIARRLFWGLGLLGTVLAAAAARPFAVYTAGTADAFPAVLAIAPAVLLSCLTAVERGYHEGLCNMYPTAISQAVEALCKLACGLLLCRWLLETPTLPPLLAGYRRDALAAAGAVLGVTLSTLAGYLCVILRPHPPHAADGVHRTDTAAIIRTLLGTMVPVALGAVMTNLTSLIDLGTMMRCFQRMLAADTAGFYTLTHLSRTIPPEEAAAFVYGSFMGLAVTVFNLVPSLTNMFAKGVLPCTAQAWAKGERAETAGLAGQVLLLTGLAAIPAGCGIFAMAEGILAFLYPNRPEEVAVAVESLQLLAPAVVCLCLAQPIFSLLQAIGRADLPVKVLLCGVVVKLAGNLLLVPRYGTAGSAAATSLCYGLILVLSLLALRREIGVPLGLLRTLLPLGYAGGMCAAACWLCYTRLLPHVPQRPAFLAGLCCAGAVYLGLLAVTCRKTLPAAFRRQA